MARPRIEPGTFGTQSDGLANYATATCMHYVVKNICFVDAGVHLVGGGTLTNQMRSFIWFGLAINNLRNGWNWYTESSVEQVVDSVYACSPLLGECSNMGHM